ncbi:MAG: hypothetical protein H7831_02655 [Magnetococcus sp. WYHC-3]
MKTYGPLFLASLLLAGTATAMAEPDKGPARMFPQMDANQDGKVTAAEHESFHNRHFQDSDGNKDGFLDSTEMEMQMLQRMKERIVQRMKALDQDGDGRLSAAEFNAKRQPERFLRHDRDGDGAVSLEEMTRQGGGGEQCRHGQAGQEGSQGSCRHAADSPGPHQGGRHPMGAPWMSQPGTGPNAPMPYGPMGYGPMPYGPMGHAPMPYGPMGYGPMQHGAPGPQGWPSMPPASSAPAVPSNP